MKPELAVFDLGKVLLDFDYSITARHLAELCEVSATELQETIDQSHLLLDYEAGKLTTDEFYAAVRGRTGYRGTFEQFREAFADIFSEIPEMVGLHGNLKNAGVPCFIFSNTNELAIRHIRRNFRFFNGFDGYVYSYEEKAMKPEARIYEAVEKATGRSGGQLLYIDDRAENIEQGRARGWRTVHHESPAASIAAFHAHDLG